MDRMQRLNCVHSCWKLVGYCYHGITSETALQGILSCGMKKLEKAASTESSKDISDSFASIFQLSNSATTISSSSEVPVSYIDPTILRVKSSTYHVKDRNARNPQRNERN